MVLHKYGDRLYEGLIHTVSLHLKEMARCIESAQGNTFLGVLNRNWIEHNKALQMIRDILMYMDRTYVLNFKKTPVHELGLNLWRDNVVKLFNVILQALITNMFVIKLMNLNCLEMSCFQRFCQGMKHQEYLGNNGSSTSS